MKYLRNYPSMVLIVLLVLQISDCTYYQKPHFLIPNIPSPPIYSLHISPDGKYIVSGSGDGTIKLWSFNGELIRTFKGHSKRVSNVIFSPDGKKILSGSYDNTVKLWLINGDLIHTFKNCCNVNDLDFSPEGDKFIAGTFAFEHSSLLFLWNLPKFLFDRPFKLWSINGQLLYSLGGFSKDGGVMSVAFSPNGEHFALGSYKRLDLRSLKGKLLNIFQPTDWVNAIVFSPDNTKILTGEEYGVNLWSVSGNLIQSFNHCCDVRAIAISSDGNTIATGASDNLVKVWSINGKLKGILHGHNDDVNSVAFFPNDKKIISGSSDSKIKLWDLKTNQLLVTMIALENDNYFTFTPDNYYKTSYKKDGNMFFNYIKNHGFVEYSKSFDRPDIVDARISGQLLSKEVVSSTLFNEGNFNFHLIYGVKDVKTMNKVAIVIGPEILEERYYRDIVKYVKGFGELDSVLVYSYPKGRSLDEISVELQTNRDKLLRYSKNMNISYFNRYMKNEEEIEQLKRIMKPYEKGKKAEYKGSCVFEQP